MSGCSAKARFSVGKGRAGFPISTLSVTEADPRGTVFINLTGKGANKKREDESRPKPRPTGGHIEVADDPVGRLAPARHPPCGPDPPGVLVVLAKHLVESVILGPVGASRFGCVWCSLVVPKNRPGDRRRPAEGGSGKANSAFRHRAVARVGREFSSCSRGWPEESVGGWAMGHRVRYTRGDSRTGLQAPCRSGWLALAKVLSGRFAGEGDLSAIIVLGHSPRVVPWARGVGRPP